MISSASLRPPADITLISISPLCRMKKASAASPWVNSVSPGARETAVAVRSMSAAISGLILANIGATLRFWVRRS